MNSQESNPALVATRAEWMSAGNTLAILPDQMGLDGEHHLRHA